MEDNAEAGLRCRTIVPTQPASSLSAAAGSESQLADNHGIDDEFGLVRAEPLDDTTIGAGFGGLAEHVRIDQIRHNVSVDSEAIGTKKPFVGHASSQSTAPAVACGGRLTRRYSPRSRRSTSNSCPGSTRSSSRISAGSTIWPLDDTRVFTLVR